MVSSRLQLEGAVVTRVTKRDCQLVAGDTIVKMKELGIADIIECGQNSVYCILENAAARGEQISMQVVAQSAQHWGSFIRSVRSGASNSFEHAEAGVQKLKARPAGSDDYKREKESYEVLRLGDLEAWFFNTGRVFIVEAEWFRHWQQWCLDRTRDDPPGTIPMDKLQEQRGRPLPGKTYLLHYNVVNEKVWKILELSHGCKGEPMPRKVGGPHAIYGEEATMDEHRSPLSDQYEEIFATNPPRNLVHGCKMAFDNLVMGLLSPCIVIAMPLDMGRAYGVAELRWDG